MSFFDDLFGGGGGDSPYQDPAAAAMPYLNQVPGVGKEYYNPFIESGRQAEGITNPIYGQMTQNPQDFLNSIMRGYSPSEGYKFKEKYLQQGAHNTAAAGGLAGTENDVLNRNELVRESLGQDMQNYLENVLGIQGRGLTGQEQRTHRGFLGSKELADFLRGNLESQATLAFQGAQGQNLFNQQNAENERLANRGFFSDILNAGTRLYGHGAFSGLGNLFGGGGGAMSGGYSPVRF